MLNYKSEAAAVYATMHMGDWTDSSTQSMGVSDSFATRENSSPPPVPTEHEAAWVPELVLDCSAEQI